MKTINFNKKYWEDAKTMKEGGCVGLTRRYDELEKMIAIPAVENSVIMKEYRKQKEYLRNLEDKSLFGLDETKKSLLETFLKIPEKLSLYQRLKFFLSIKYRRWQMYRLCKKYKTWSEMNHFRYGSKFIIPDKTIRLHDKTTITGE